jgi:hypothetical protein
MATKSKQIDHGGNDLIVRSVKLASKPHQNGTEILSSTTLTGGSLALTFPTGAATAAGGDSLTAGATHVLPVVINGTTYYILMNTDNA